MDAELYESWAETVIDVVAPARHSRERSLERADAPQLAAGVYVHCMFAHGKSDHEPSSCAASQNSAEVLRARGSLGHRSELHRRKLAHGARVIAGRDRARENSVARPSESALEARYHRPTF
jgi:hypothetical protein